MNTVVLTDRRSALKAGIVVAALAIVAILGYRQLARISAIPVWTTSAALDRGTTLGAANLKQTRLLKKAVPAGALTDRRAIVGQILRAAKASDQPFFAHDFAVPSRPPVTPLAAHVPAGRVLTTLTIDPMSIPYPQLRFADRLEIVAVKAMGTTNGHGRVVARDVFMIGSLAPNQGKQAESKKGALGMDISPPKRAAKGGAKGLALILALHPRDVLPLAEAESENATLKLVLHGKNEVDRGALLSLESPPPKVIELIAGAAREEVTIRR